jgi:hypothetical protein
VSSSSREGRERGGEEEEEEGGGGGKSGNIDIPCCGVFFSFFDFSLFEESVTLEKKDCGSDSESKIFGKMTSVDRVGGAGRRDLREGGA